MGSNRSPDLFGTEDGKTMGLCLFCSFFEKREQVVYPGN